MTPCTHTPTHTHTSMRKAYCIIKYDFFKSCIITMFIFIKL